MIRILLRAVLPKALQHGMTPWRSATHIAELGYCEQRGSLHTQSCNVQEQCIANTFSEVLETKEGCHISSEALHQSFSGQDCIYSDRQQAAAGETDAEGNSAITEHSKHYNLL